MRMSIRHQFINSYPPSAEYMRRWTGWIGSDNPLFKPMLGYCQLDPWEPTFSENLIKMQKFSLTKMLLKISSAKRRSFCPGGDELIHWTPGDMVTNPISQLMV